MRSIIAKMAAAVVAGTMALASAAPVSAQNFSEGGTQYNQRDRYVVRYCDQYPNDRDCRDWRDNRHRWSDRRYQQWYRSHHNNGGDAIALGIFGLAIGAIVNGAINNSQGNYGSSHVRRCEARYQSYDRRSDTYLGFDGDRHRCRL